MAERNRSVYLEHILTFLLFLSSMALLGGVLSLFSIYACVGLVCGLIFSWFNPQVADYFWVKTASKVAALITVIWTFYAVFNSTFAYQEVVLIYIKGAFILGIILSFNLSSAGNLNYAQVLSVPIFMTFPIFTTSLNPWQIVLLAVYFAIWVVLLRVKFCLSFAPSDEINLSESQHLLPFIFFLSAIALAWGLYYSIILPVNKEGGLLRQQGMVTTLDALEKEYYGMRDKVQDKATKITFNLPTTEQRLQSLSDVEALVNEKALTIEVNNAEDGLISYAKLTGAGNQPGKEPDFTITLKGFVNKKIQFNLKKANSRMMEILRENPLNIVTRIMAVIEGIKLQQADTLDKLRKYKQDMQATIAKASLDDSAKKEENKLMQKVQDWKVFQLYREKMQKLKSQLNSFSADAQNALSKVWSGVKEAQTQEQLEKAEEENSRFQASTQPQVKAFANELKEAANLKRIMLVKKEGDEIDSKLQNSYLPEEHLNELKDAVNTLQYTDNSAEFVNKHQSLRNVFEQENVNASSQLNALSNMKSSVMLNQAKNDLYNTLSQFVPQGLLNKMYSDLSDALNAKSSSVQASAFDKAQDNLRRFRGNDFISASLEAKAQNNLNDIKRLAEFKADSKSQERKPTARNQQNREDAGINNPRKLVRLSITPLLVIVASGRDAPIHAIGFYDDNSQKEITTDASWKVSNELRAKITGGKVYGLSVGKASFYAEYSGISSSPGAIVVTDPLLTAIAVKPALSVIGLDDKLVLKAEGYLSDNSKRDMTEFVTWYIQGRGILKQGKGYFIPLAFGQEYIWAEYSGIKSLPVKVKVVVTLLWLLKISAIGILILLIVIILVLGVFYLLSRMKAREIAGLAAIDKRAFIVALYNNSIAIFKIFDMGNKSNLPPIAYALRIAAILGPGQDIFERFAVKYEEAQFSQHLMTDEDATSAHSMYHDMMNIMLQQQRGAKSIFIHPFRLLKRIPIFI